jgi:hypothetical protein
MTGHDFLDLRELDDHRVSVSWNTMTQAYTHYFKSGNTISIPPGTTGIFELVEDIGETLSIFQKLKAYSQLLFLYMISEPDLCKSSSELFSPLVAKIMRGRLKLAEALSFA